MKEAKLPELKPIQYIDVVNPRMLKQWLSNSVARGLWEEAVDFYVSDLKQSDESRSKVANQLYKIPKKPDNYQDIDPIALGGTIKEYVDTVLKQWKDDSDNTSAMQMVVSLPLFIEMSKYLPHVNPSKEYKTAFRGTDFTDAQIKRFVRTYRNPVDWKTTRIAGTVYYTYVGSKKGKFIYTPHRAAQSWSVSDQAAAGFGSSMVATTLDKSFFFDPAFMAQYGYEHEQETVHFGKEPIKVALLVDEEDYNKARDINSWDDEDLTEDTTSKTIEVQDEDGTLTIPL